MSTPEPPRMAGPGASGLGPHCVGARVVVRRLLPGVTGPTGGPAFTDLLGVMLAWTGTETVLETATGDRVRIALAEIVSGKPVPPRPSPRLRVRVEEAQRRAMAGWPPTERVPLGEWVLRAAGGFTARANSVLALGDPGLPLARALAEVVGFYAARGLPPRAQVVVGTGPADALAGAGWVPARPGRADTAFRIASVAQARRALVDVPRTGELTGHAGDAWLAAGGAPFAPAAARAVLEGPAEVAFLAVGDPVVAKGRVALTEDWAGLTDVWVAPGRRQRGLGRTVLAGLLDWAAERGAGTAYLQIPTDDTAALAFSDALGFVTHHEYRYLAAPPR